MPWPVHPTGFFGARGDQDTYKIERSLRFNSADSAYLNRTLVSPTNNIKWTLSWWMKKTTNGLSSGGGTGDCGIISTSNSGNTDSIGFYNADDQLRVLINSSTVAAWSPVIRDVSAWYHFVVVYDSANSTQSDRLVLYQNGARVTSLSSAVSLTSSQSIKINSAQTHYIGSATATPSRFFNGYLTEINFIDGQALTPSSFGETDAITGRWKAKAYGGTYGTNGFYLKFADNSGTTDTTLGKDSSGNGNNWTPNNFSVADGTGNDSLLDSPTNSGTSGNYATLNPLKASSTSASISDGNLDVTFPQASQARRQGSLAVKTGKYYFETRIVSVGGNYPAVGVMLASTSDMNNYAGFETGTFGYYSGGGVNGGGAGRTYSTYTTDDIIGVALDLDNSQIVFYKNGVNAVTSGTLYESLTSGEIYVPAVSGFNGARLIVNFGQRPFAYTAPTGFKALCTTNLPQPTIQKPSKYMDVVTYTGNGSTQTISSLGFSPDLVWVKGRSQTSANHILTDSVRGNGKSLMSNNTNAEGTRGATLSSNGFSFTYPDEGGDANFNAATYVAWAWDEAPIAGMDIVSYTGNGTNRTIAHNLGVAPKMMIVKNRSNASDWGVYHIGLTSASYYVYLQSTISQNLATTMWNGTAPTSSVFSVGTSANVNTNNDNYIAYLFAEVEGFSRFGSYTGNGSADGPFVWCGFRPRWVLCKGSSVVSNWVIYDTQRNTFNVVNNNLYPALASAEDTSAADIDILSNGFKFREGSALNPNTSGDTYIFAAFAEAPFKYARAR